MPTGAIHLERPDAATAWITVDHPERRNAMSLHMWQALAEALATVEADAEVRVIVLRGAGGLAFVSGADISEFATRRASAEAARDYDRAAGRALGRLRATPIPTIAMIEGFCIGGGLLLALCCDLRYAADDATFSIPAARVGLGYNWAAVKDLIDAAGAPAAKEMLFTAERYDAQEGRVLGLVNRVLPKAELEAFTRRLAGRIADNAPLTIRAAKAAVAELLKPGAEVDVARCEALVAECMDSADYREGREAFMAKRRPVFRGR